MISLALIGRRIASARKTSGITQLELARKAGVRPSFWELLHRQVNEQSYFTPSIIFASVNAS